MRLNYKEIEDTYKDIKLSASGRQACTIMVMVANEVDAMASARMLLHMFQQDNIAYVMRPVANIKQVKKVYESYVTADIKSIILINCGAIYNLPKLFHLEQGGEVRVFVMDNHRPLNLANIYSRHSVVVFDAFEVDNDDLEVPSDGSVLSVEESSSSSSDDSDVESEGYDDDEAEEDVEEDDKESEAEAELDDEVIGSQKIESSNEDNQDADDETGEEEDGENEDEDAVEEKVEDEGASDADAESGSEDNDEPEDDAESEADNESEHGDSADLSGSKRDRNENIDKPAEKEDENEEDEGDRVVGKRRKVLEENYNPEKIRRRKLREYYTQNAAYSAPTALMMMHLVYGRHGTHLPLNLLWQAILGITDQFLRNHITEATYEVYCGYLREELSDHITSASDRAKYVVSEGDAETTVSGYESGNIKEGPDYRFFMHRHWSLFEAMYHSPYIASKMLVWQTSGTNKLQELLAKIGLPLQQSQQNFNFIPPKLIAQFKNEISSIATRGEYNLTNPGVMFRSFYRYNSFKNPIAASDVVLAATALLEKAQNSAGRDILPSQTSTPLPTTHGNALSTGGTTPESVDDDNANDASRLTAFNQAYDCLNNKATDLLKKGISTSIDLQKIIVRKAAILLEDHSLIVRLHRFHYCKIDSSNQGALGQTSGRTSELDVDEPFTRPQVLTRLGQFIMDVKRNIPARHGGWTGSSLLPLIMLSHKRSTASFLVVGISPLISSTMQNEISESQQRRLHILTNFKHMFKIASGACGARFWNDSFDTSVVEVGQDDVSDFLGELNDLMRRAGV